MKDFDNQKIIELAKKYGLTPKKSLGQNFLINDKVVFDTIKAANLDFKDTIVEIGPGFGVLTEELVKKFKKVIVIEYDKAAIEYIKNKFGNQIELIEGDVLNISNQEIFDKAGGEYHIIANIPYSITSPILQKFTESEPKPESLTLMIQKEVAQRVTAKVGDMSILAVAVQFYGNPQYLFTVPKTDFWPSPAVDSAVIRFVPDDIYQKKLKVTLKDFFRVVKFGFAARRKKLVNTLAAGLHLEPKDISPIITSFDINPMARAQELSLDQWVALANMIYKK